MEKVIVIGSGVAGLATAALLAKDGYEVTVLEKNKDIGGRGRVWKNNGYTFDMGPSWYMMPQVFENYLKIFGKKVADFYQLKRLPIHYRVFFDNNRKYDIKTELEENIKLFELTEPGSGIKLREYLTKSKEIYDASMKELVLFDYSNWQKLLNWSLFSNLFKIPLWGNFHQTVEKYFKNKDLQKILEFTTVFLGGNPYNTPSFYTLMSHVDMGLGLWYPMGGINQIFKMLQSLALENGAKIKTETEVTKILVADKKAIGVETENKKIDADIIVSGADYWFTESNLLPKKYQSYPDNYWQKATLAPSAVVIYLGLKGKLKNLHHHNLYFSENWENGFKEVYESKKWPNNPSYYVHVPSVTDTSVAPINGETVMILVPVAPYLKDNNKTRNNFGNMIIKHLERLIHEKIEDKIIVKRIFSHQDFINDYHALGGAAFGLAHTLKQSAFFRPRNYSQKVENLFYTGQYTNPGVGVPIGILSSLITRNLINKFHQNL